MSAPDGSASRLHKLATGVDMLISKAVMLSDSSSTSGRINLTPSHYLYTI